MLLSPEHQHLQHWSESAPSVCLHIWTCVFTYYYLLYLYNAWIFILYVLVSQPLIETHWTYISTLLLKYHVALEMVIGDVVIGDPADSSCPCDFLRDSGLQEPNQKSFFQSSSDPDWPISQNLTRFYFVVNPDSAFALDKPSPESYWTCIRTVFDASTQTQLVNPDLQPLCSHLCSRFGAM